MTRAFGQADPVGTGGVHGRRNGRWRCGAASAASLAPGPTPVRTASRAMPTRAPRHSWMASREFGHLIAEVGHPRLQGPPQLAELQDQALLAFGRRLQVAGFAGLLAGEGSLSQALAA